MLIKLSKFVLVGDKPPRYKNLLLNFRILEVYACWIYRRAKKQISALASTGFCNFSYGAVDSHMWGNIWHFLLLEEVFLHKQVFHTSFHFMIPPP